MRLRWQVDHDRVTRSNYTTDKHHAHDAGLPDDVALRVAADHLREQSGLKVLYLHARITQPGDLHDRRIADEKPRAGWQFE